MLDGVFAFVLYDTRDRTYVAARDAIGVNPLYIGWGSDGACCTSSIFPFTFLHTSACVVWPVILSDSGRQSGRKKKCVRTILTRILFGRRTELVR